VFVSQTSKSNSKELMIHEAQEQEAQERNDSFEDTRFVVFR
jgi:hypothetical protein